MDDFSGSVKGVLFDAGNTLIHVLGSVGEVYASVARRHGVETVPEELDSKFHTEFGRRKGSFIAGVSRPHTPQREKAWWRELVTEVFRGVPGLMPADPQFGPFFEDLYQEFEKPEHWRLFPDVEPCLAALAEHGVPVAVVSNWDSRLHPVLEGLGIAEQMRFVLTSAEFGAEKPDPSIFHEAARRLGLNREHVLHVGDLLREDVEGACRAGLQAVWLCRGQDAYPCPGEAICVCDLARLANAVARAAP